MATLEAATAVVSLIPDLEPLAGISLAVNLAYLNLQRWRYRQAIRGIAKRGLGELNQRQNDDGSIVSGLPQLRGLKVLAGDENNLNKLPVFIRVFELFFGKELDVRLGVFFSIFAVLMLTVGVAHNIGVWSSVVPISVGKWAASYFYVLIGSLVSPAISVILGRYLVEKSTEYADDCFKQLSSVYERQIAQAQLPVQTPRAQTPVPASLPSQSDIAHRTGLRMAAARAANTAAGVQAQNPRRKPDDPDCE